MYAFFEKKEVIVPCLVGKSVQQALKEASCVGLTIRLLREQETVDVIPGTILEQNPKEHQKVRPHHSIFVTVAARRVCAMMPDFLGKSQEEIAKQLNKLGVQVNFFYCDHHFENGLCFAQSPLPGSELRNHECSIYCSSGKKKKFVIPDYCGRRLNDVHAALQRDGVTVEIFHSDFIPPNHTCEQCVVKDQKPVAGSIVDADKLRMIQVQV